MSEELFDKTNNKFVMPSNSTFDEKLISAEVESAITSNMVKNIIIPESTNVLLPNFVIDFSKCNEITVFQKKSLQSIINKQGDVAIYLYNKSSMTFIGYGISEKLEVLLPIMRNEILKDEILIYKNVSNNGIIEEVTHTDVTKLRLRL